MLAIIDWLLKIEGFVNKFIDFLLRKDKSPQTTTQQNVNAPNAIINAKIVKIYNFNPEQAEKNIREQEERLQDLEIILESEVEGISNNQQS